MVVRCHDNPQTWTTATGAGPRTSQAGAPPTSGPRPPPLLIYLAMWVCCWHQLRTGSNCCASNRRVFPECCSSRTVPPTCCTDTAFGCRPAVRWHLPASWSKLTMQPMPPTCWHMPSSCTSGVWRCQVCPAVMLAGLPCWLTWSHPKPMAQSAQPTLIRRHCSLGRPLLLLAWQTAPAAGDESCAHCLPQEHTAAARQV